jgi:hypothetical protein
MRISKADRKVVFVATDGSGNTHCPRLIINTNAKLRDDYKGKLNLRKVFAKKIFSL